MDGRNVDFSGFTKQTATILCGIGAKDLIREFRKKDLSTSALFKLTKEDFMQLGNISISTIILLSYFEQQVLYALNTDIFIYLFMTSM